MTTRLSALAFTLPLLATAAAAQTSGRGQDRFEAQCRPPLKFVAGTCVPQCPAGYEDRGRTCAFRNMSGGAGGR